MVIVIYNSFVKFHGKKKFESRKHDHVISKLYYNEVYYEGTKLRVYSLNTFLATHGVDPDDDRSLLIAFANMILMCRSRGGEKGSGPPPPPP